MVQAGDGTDVNDQERDPGAVLGVETGGRCERWYGRQDEDPSDGLLYPHHDIKNSQRYPSVTHSILWVCIDTVFWARWSEF